MAIKPRDLAKIIDHTLLSPTANVEDVKQLCKEAIEHKFAAVCVNPIFVPMAVKLLKDTSVKVASVVGFPLGSNTTEAKAFQTKQLVKEGVQEIGMVLNLGAFKSGAYDLVKADIKAVTDAARISSLGAGALVKVIFETGYLSEEELVKASEIVLDGRADFIETTTGYGPYDANEKDISIIRKRVGRDIGVKASVGIETFIGAVDMLDAGANRLGTVHGIDIITDKKD